MTWRFSFAAMRPQRPHGPHGRGAAVFTAHAMRAHVRPTPGRQRYDHITRKTARRRPSRFDSIAGFTSCLLIVSQSAMCAAGNSCC